MFSDILLMIRRKKIETFYYLILFLIVFLFTWWSNPSLTPATSPDTTGYLSVAKNFSDPVGELRPIFYPLFIRLCMVISTNHWGEIVVAIQMILHSATILLLFTLYTKHNISIVFAFIFSIAIGFNPNLLLYCSRLLPQQFLGVLIALSFYYAWRLMEVWDDYPWYKNKYLYLTGTFSGLALITKPAWLLGIFPVIMSIMLIKKISIKSVMISIFLIIIHFLPNTIWQQYNKSFDNEKVYGIDGNIIERTLFSLKGNNFNQGIIRLGLVDYGKGTPLYDLLKEKDLLELARSMDGSVTSDYTFIRESLTWVQWNDVEFAKAILTKAPLKYFVGQLSTWYQFFNKRMFYPDGFPGLPDIGKYIYIGSYYNLYRPFLPILLILFLTLFKVENFKSIVMLNSLILIYFSLLHALYTPSPQHFIFYRTSVEYILFFAAFFPIGYLYNRIQPQIIQIYKQKINAYFIIL